MKDKNRECDLQAAGCGSAVCGELVGGLLEQVEVVDDRAFQVRGRDRRWSHAIILGDKFGELRGAQYGYRRIFDR